MKYVDFTVAGNRATARDTVSAARADRRFNVTWSDDSAFAGGAIGAARTRRNVTSLKDELTQIFGAAGVLADVAEG